jgi:hypothetical protein
MMGFDRAEGFEVMPRFIVGMPRAGTTWISHCLNQHPDVAVFGETMFWGKAFVAPDAQRRYDRVSMQRVKARLLAKPLETTIHIAGPGMLKNVRAHNTASLLRSAFDAYADGGTAADVFRSIAGRIAQAEEKKEWVEKTPHHVYHVRRILEHLPSARFIIAVRNPYSFINSYKFQPGYQRTAESRRRFEARYHPLAAALVWTRCWRATHQAMREIPDQVMVVRMEDIESKPLEVVGRIQLFFGLRQQLEVQGLTQIVNSSFDQGSRPDVMDAEIAWINLVAGARVREAGYEWRQVSFASPAFWKSELALFPWAVRFLWNKAYPRRRD